MGEHLEAKHQERAQYYSKAPTELIYEDAELVHDKTTIDLFWLFKYPSQEKEEFTQNHTTILRDEYKIEDMMVIVKESLAGRDQLRLQDLFKETQNIQGGHHPLLATLELIKTQELILVQGGGVSEISISWKRRKKVKWPKARLDREEKMSTLAK